MVPAGSVKVVLANLVPDTVKIMVIKTCSGAFILKNGRYLLGRRSDHHSWYAGMWDIFGGHVEPGETSLSTLQRELQEELGISGAACELFRTAEVTGNASEKIIYDIYFVTSWEGGDPSNRGKEHSEIRWFSRQELNALTLATSEYLRLIDDWEGK